MKQALLLFPLAVLIVGCQSAAPVAEKTESPKTEVPKAEAPAEAPKAALTLPDGLKNAAFEYYGLGTDAPMDFELNTGPGQGTLTGSQTTRLVAVDGDKATFEVTRTGALSDLGNSQLVLEKDGLYLKSSSFVQVGDRQMELPADLAPGKTWKSDIKIERDGQTSTLTSTNKVAGTRSVTTPVATYPDALLVESNGTGTLMGVETSVVSKLYFVKGRGAVKTEIVRTPKGGTPVRMTIQESKPAAAPAPDAQTK